MEKTQVSLVLGSGGARGYAHIGVIEELQRYGCEIVSISGTSMGALIGGLYACGKLAEYKAWVLTLEPLDVAGLLDLAWDRRGFMNGTKVFNRLEQMIGSQKIEALPVRYTAVHRTSTTARRSGFKTATCSRRSGRRSRSRRSSLRSKTVTGFLSTAGSSTRFPWRRRCPTAAT